MKNPNLTTETELAQTFITRGEARRLAHQLGFNTVVEMRFFDAGQGDGTEIAFVPAGRNGGFIADAETRKINKIIDRVFS